MNAKHHCNISSYKLICFILLQMFYPLWQTAGAVSFQQWENHFFSKQSLPLYQVFHTQRTFQSPFPGIQHDERGCLKRCIYPFSSPNCYMPENTTKLNLLKNRTRTTLQPNLQESHRCTILLLTSLSQPQWVSINCNETLLSTVACFKSKFFKISVQPTFQPGNKSCEFLSFFVDGKCIQMFWLAHHNTTLSCPTTRLKQLRYDGSYFSKLWHNAISATNIKILTFVSNSNEKHLVATTFQKEWTQTNIQVHTKSEKLECIEFAWTLCFSLPFSVPKNQYIFFQCSTRQIISTAFLCDGFSDCNNNSSFKGCDEAFCIDQIATGIMYKNTFPNCSPLFFMAKNRACLSFLSHNQDNYIILERAKHTANDLIQDTTEDNESEFKNLLKNLAFVHDKCQEKNLFSCFQGHSTCYHPFNICLYKLDRNRNLIPCRTGAHIQECVHFECFNTFKCPDQYCIPWEYVCNGISDCPFGFDESKRCDLRDACKLMYKCRHSTKCVHTTNVCYESINCPTHDDEMLCELLHFKCLSGCQCLNFAVFCFNISLQIQHWEFIPLVAFSLLQCSMVDISLLRNTYASVINLTENQIKTMCHVPVQAQMLSMLDLSHNQITSVSSECVKGLRHLQFIGLKSNKLDILEKFAFSCLNTISFDFSNNSLETFHSKIFKNISKILTLSLINNCLYSFDLNFLIETNVQTMLTNKFQICCFVQEGSKCFSPNKKWFNSCEMLLPQQGVGVLFALFSINILLLNFSSLINLRKQIKRDPSSPLNSTSNNKYAGPYYMIVCLVNLGDLLFGLHLLVVWAANVYFGKDFTAHFLQWKESAACGSSFFFNIFHALLMPLVLAFLAVSRLMVVKQPFDSRFKSSKFVVKCLLVFLFSAAGISSLETTVLILLQRQLPSVMCSPFVDPSDSFATVKVNIWAILFIEIVAIGCMSFASIDLVNHLKESAETSGNKKTEETSTVLKLSVSVLMPLICWVPSSTIFLCCSFMQTYPPSLIQWTTVIVMPLNCLVNPFVLASLHSIFASCKCQQQDKKVKME